jgi:hypothetical protein
MDFYSACPLVCSAILRAGTNICRAANAIATQMKSHRYAPDLGYRCIRDISWIHPRCIPDSSQIYPTFWIYLEYIPDLSEMEDEFGIHLFIPHISGIPRLGGS